MPVNLATDSFLSHVIHCIYIAGNIERNWSEEIPCQMVIDEIISQSPEPNLFGVND